jgi:hypothetical protein
MMKPAARLLAHFTPMDMEDHALTFYFLFVLPQSYER